MTLNIQSATVLGAGTMGAAIAGLLADAGIHVHLLDIALDPDPDLPFTRPSPEQVGRSQIAWQGLDRMANARPPNLVHKESLKLVEPGNLDENLETAVGKSDWILEAVTEDLQVKRDLLRRIAALNPKCSLVSTNTSGLPIHMLAEGLPDRLASRFLGTHFFNPPRYLPLLELIPHEATDPGLLADVSDFSSARLGRETVICRDTPYFIANRLFAFLHQVTINTALDLNLSVAEVDGLTGSLLGRPNAATFRLADIVGLDVMDLVCRNLDALTPNDPMRSVRLHAGYRALLQNLLSAGYQGAKSGQGFYRTVRDQSGKRKFMSLDLPEAVENRLTWQEEPRFQDDLVDQLRSMPLAERFPALLAMENRYGEFIWQVHSQMFTYLTHIAGEISEGCHDIDRVMRTGFGWKLGPYELWDTLGPSSVGQMQTSGLGLGKWVVDTPYISEDDRGSGPMFHCTENGRRSSWHFSKGMQPIKPDADFHTFGDAVRSGSVIAENDSGCLRSGQDGILFLETRSKLNTIDEPILSLCQEACNHLHGTATAFIVTNDDEIFSAGANLKQVLAFIEDSNWKELERLSKLGQDTFMALRQAPKPTWASMRGMAAGGGVELSLALDGVVVHPEACLGLPEAAVGLIPGWGGCKELVRRGLDGEFITRGGDPFRFLQQVHTQVAMAKVSDNARDAKTMGYLPANTITVGRKSRLLPWAVQEVRRSLELGYVPPATRQNTYAVGRDGLANLKTSVYMMRQGGYISEHDALIASKLAYVLSGGSISSPTWMDEQWFLDLELETNLSLAGESKTRDRIAYMLTHKKPLRN